MTTMMAIGALLALNVGLLWLLMAAPLGRRIVRAHRILPAGFDAVWQAVHPAGRNAAWSASVLTSELLDGSGENGQHRVEQAYSHHDRKGQPIRRTLLVTDNATVETEARFETLVVDDSALDNSFWADYRETRYIRSVPQGTEILVEQEDVYKGLAFYLFRWFLLRRELAALDHWLLTGQPHPGGWLEHPSTQVALAALSTLLLWPFFGLTLFGFAMSLTLTSVIVLHELGHMVAYRACGHHTTRMIFIPLLGGVAIGGRPYDSLFEVAFCALMGAGVSAFVVAIPLALFPRELHAHHLGWEASGMLVFMLVCGAFNLLNLLPVVRFDGGQVLRQVFRTRTQLGIGSFVVAVAILLVGWRVNVPDMALVAALAVFALMSLLMAGRSVRPRESLDEMTVAQRVLVAGGFAAAVGVHGAAIVFAADRLFA